MSDLVLGINEDDLSSLSFEVLDYADRISEILDKIDDCMDRLSDHYQSEACEALMAKYNDIVPYYRVIRNNIVSYSDDFIELIKKMRENEKYITTLFQEYTDETIKKTKSVMK